MLAPLFDRMLTHDLKRRFTADEALEFFQNEYSELIEQQLNRLTYPHPCEEGTGFWLLGSHTPPHLAEKWACHRTPPMPLSYLVLRWLCKKMPMEHVEPLIWWLLFGLVVPWTWWLLFNLVGFPRLVLKSLRETLWSETGFQFCAAQLHSKCNRNGCWMIMSCHQYVHSLSYFWNFLDRHWKMPNLGPNSRLLSRLLDDLWGDF